MTTTTIDISNVTPEQIDRCSRIIDLSTNKPFYLVLSETDNLTEYKVEYHTHPTKHFSCTCRAGQNGFANCRQGYCKHIKWAMAAADLSKAEQKALCQRQEQAAKQAKLDRIRKFVELGLTHDQALVASETHTTLDDESLARTIKAPVRRGSKPRNDTRVFSLMR